MNTISRCLAIVLGVSVIAGCAVTGDTAKEDGACYLKAGDSDVYVRVFELDSGGNMGPLVWQGRINQGQTARIKTTHARFRYFFKTQPDIDQPLNGGLDKACDDHDVVKIP